MLSKRRRASSNASRQEDDIADDSTPEQSPVLSTSGGTSSSRKRKKLDPSEMCQQLYDSIRNIKKEDGSMLCDTFIRAPKRRQEPSYYEVVNNPIDLLRVQQKLKTDSYEDIEELATDFELLVNNAKAFYKSDTTEYNDACTLWEYFNTNKAKLLESMSNDDEPRTKRIGRPPRRSNTIESDPSQNTSASDDDFDPYEELFASVMMATDPTQNDRPLHREFQLLPSKKLWPDYYDVIEHPIDLRLIATKIQTNAYSNLNEMEKDLLQMTKNAIMFNEPGSQIYKDAKTLKKIFTAKKAEIELGRAQKTVFKKRGGQTLSSVTAALKEEIGSSDDDDESASNKSGEGPMWQLFDALFNAASASDNPNATGAPLGQSLWKLPHRRFHPEYYEMIKKPISMAQIQKKLKRSDYANINDLTADLYLMLDNAKRAFPPTHKIYKDAAKMLKLMNSKLIDSKVEQDASDPEELDPLSSLIPTPVEGVTAAAESTPLTLNRQKKKFKLVTSSNGTPKTPRAPTGIALRKKLTHLAKFLNDFTVDGRKPMKLFMEKPSKKVYPDYYNIIQHPIDMTTIENNIRADFYKSIEDCVADWRLMFENCRKFNEEGSMIYEDANNLEKALNERLKDISFYSEKKVTSSKMSKILRKATLTPLEKKLWQLYETIRDYNEPKGNRQLSLIFMKLPNKNNIFKNLHKCSWTFEQFEEAIKFLKEGRPLRQVAKLCGIPESTLREKRRDLDYPDYYDIIKNPIDMEKILHKLKQQHYGSVDEMAADFLLMFENACKYNEPDSQIYKDALVLQQLCIQTKQSLRDNEETVPDIGLSVQELLMCLFTALYNHQDEEGRCYSDSLAELPEYDEIDTENKIRGISLDLVKRRLDKGLYERLDQFQEDVFACLERARKLSRTDSQVFEDSIELQQFFIKKRNELCKDVLTSPAMSYDLTNLQADVESLRQSKLLKEEAEQEDVDEAATGESMTIDQKVYSPGDFVYFESVDNKVPGIIYIERLYTDSNNVKMCYGNIFLRPPETYHVTTRKFLEQEVFKSDQHQAIPLDKLLNKCYVMCIKDYIKYKPEGFQDKDIYVCESRYNMKQRFFNKIKSWAFKKDTDSVRFTQREQPLELKRIMSVFKERVEKHKGELAELQLQEALVEKEKPNIICQVENPEEGYIYYEQYNTICSGVVKLGDYVYVASQSGKQSIAQIHSIWETGGKSYFQGPWLLSPSELSIPTIRSFYRQELLLSTVHDTNPIIAIVGRCAVLDYAEYTMCRPTGIPESDVYICEAIYDEMKKSIKKFLPEQTLKKFTHSEMVTKDEIFHFKKPIKPRRPGGNYDIKSPSSDTKIDPNELFGMMDDSLDGIAVASTISDNPQTLSPAPSICSTPILTKGRPPKHKKIITGFILYAGEIRQRIRSSNPDLSFGEISKMVGVEWKNLPSTIRQAWEDKAAKINAEVNNPHPITSINEDGTSCAIPTSIMPSDGVGRQQIYECLWNKCNYQFEDPIDCMQHCIAEDGGHVQNYYIENPAGENEYQCLWRTCLRFKRNMQPFPHLQRLIKHVREVHLNKGGKIVYHTDRTKIFVKSKNPQPNTQNGTQALTSVNTIDTNGQNTTQQQQQMNISPQQQISPTQSTNFVPVQPPPPPPEPMFVTVPPRPQRVIHSEAYIRYIEGLQNNTPSVSAWEKTLNASQQTISPVDAVKLPVNWLGPAAKQNPDQVVNALWHLRNFMMKDVLEIKRQYF